jgi:hypothetical protein
LFALPGCGWLQQVHDTAAGVSASLHPLSQSLLSPLSLRCCRIRKILGLRLWPSREGSKAWDENVVQVRPPIGKAPNITGRLTQ